MKRLADSPSRRFHWRARDKRKLRGWEIIAWNALFSPIPEARMWAAVFCDAVKCVYRVRTPALAKAAFDWVRAPRSERLGSFENLCEALGMDPLDVRRDIVEDIVAGQSAARLSL